ncbi:MAG: DNA polymerase IV [bacterium]
MAEVTLTTRRIAHLDMDAFYASVELLRYPELKGLPVVIGGRAVHQPTLGTDGVRELAKLRNYAGRGVVTTSTYEARALGVFSAMGMMKAAKLAPEAILLPADFQAYRHYSRLFKAAVADIAPIIEDRGIDEIYIDLTDHTELTIPLAQQIKHAVTTATGLSCSIGIAPNKLLAKICSELDKPNGMTVLHMSDVETRIWPMPVKKINGIGPKASEKLAKLGIVTIGELAAAQPSLLAEYFGLNYAVWLHHVAHGTDERPVVTSSEPKSISRETTFERDLHVKHDKAALTEIFTNLCKRVASDLERKAYVGKTVGIKLRFDDFHTLTRDVTLVIPTDNAAEIRRVAGECLKRVPLDKRIRLLGVRVGSLSKKNTHDDEPSAPQAELLLS